LKSLQNAPDVAIVGGGPAGLRTAEILSSSGVSVTLYEGKPSVGRKFLIAGRGGLNLTHSEEKERFVSCYKGSHPEGFWTSLLNDFDNEELRKWAQGLGVETFIGTSGRVFPREFQSAHLLRRWIKRLKEQGILFKTRWKWVRIDQSDGRFSLSFLTQEGKKSAAHDAVILALGGASWPETGSDASWVPILKELGLEVHPLKPANCGWEVNWNTDILTVAEGQPLKNLTVTAGGVSVLGELLITQTGLEGGALYQLGSVLRKLPHPELFLDLKPTFSDQELALKIANSSADNILSFATRKWRLSAAASSLLRAYASPDALNSPLLLSKEAKALRIPLTAPRPIAEAISSAGGVSFEELDDHLMVRRIPGLFLAGEMLDWEAPTGGYLLQGCFATATRAARGAVIYLSKGSPGTAQSQQCIPI
jgi:uncharacterized flavoprotein (TIGR03862 family)